MTKSFCASPGPTVLRPPSLGGVTRPARGPGTVPSTPPGRPRPRPQARLCAPVVCRRPWAQLPPLVHRRNRVGEGQRLCLSPPARGLEIPSGTSAGACGAHVSRGPLTSAVGVQAVENHRAPRRVSSSVLGPRTSWAPSCACAAAEVGGDPEDCPAWVSPPPRILSGFLCAALCLVSCVSASLFPRRPEALASRSAVRAARCSSDPEPRFGPLPGPVGLPRHDERGRPRAGACSPLPLSHSAPPAAGAGVWRLSCSAPASREPLPPRFQEPRPSLRLWWGAPPAACLALYHLPTRASVPPPSNYRLCGGCLQPLHSHVLFPVNSLRCPPGPRHQAAPVWGPPRAGVWRPWPPRAAGGPGQGEAANAPVTPRQQVTGGQTSVSS